MELWPLVDKEKAREKAKAKERAKEKGKEKVTKRGSPPGAAKKRKAKTNGQNKQKAGKEGPKKSAGLKKMFAKYGRKTTTSARSPSTQEPQFA